MLKNILLWRYGRTTWQYDVMCVLILAFIFLTPKHWFERGEPRSVAAHRNQSTLLRFGVASGETRGDERRCGTHLANARDQGCGRSRHRLRG